MHTNRPVFKRPFWVGHSVAVLAVPIWYQKKVCLHAEQAWMHCVPEHHSLNGGLVFSPTRFPLPHPFCSRLLTLTLDLYSKYSGLFERLIGLYFVVLSGTTLHNSLQLSPSLACKVCRIGLDNIGVPALKPSSLKASAARCRCCDRSLQSPTRSFAVLHWAMDVPTAVCGLHSKLQLFSTPFENDQCYWNFLHRPELWDAIDSKL